MNISAHTVLKQDLFLKPNLFQDSRDGLLQSRLVAVHRNLLALLPPRRQQACGAGGGDKQAGTEI